MTTDRAARRKMLSLVAAADLEVLEREGKLPPVSRISWGTVLADVGFWLVYGGALALVAYITVCA